MDQALLLRGSREFVDQAEYETFLQGLFDRVNSNRTPRFQEERAQLRPLPADKLEAFTRLDVRVGPASTIRVQNNTYSVPSRLIGEQVRVKLFAERLEVEYGQQRLLTFPRLRGRAKARIDSRHLIEGLLRKPGAFDRYPYREELFPSTLFRMAFDQLERTHPRTANREYLQILRLAAQESQERGEAAILEELGNTGMNAAGIQAHLTSPSGPENRVPVVAVASIDLRTYDALLSGGVPVETSAPGTGGSEAP